MAALDRSSLRGHTHALSVIPETTGASPEVALPPRPGPPPLGPRETSDQTDAFPPLPSLPTHSVPSTRSGRSQSLAIKRKPLSPSASPVATRYSTRDYLEAIQQLPRPEQRFSRSCSLDSPTLYEFPDHRTLLAAGLLKAVNPTTADSEASRPYVLDSSPAQRPFLCGEMVARLTDKHAQAVPLPPRRSRRILCRLARQCRICETFQTSALQPLKPPTGT